jgi:hypothetical protein
LTKQQQYAEIQKPRSSLIKQGKEASLSGISQNNNPINMKRGYYFYIVAEAWNILLLAAFFLFSLFVLQSHLNVFTDRFATQVYSIIWRAILIMLVLTFMSLPIAIKLSNVIIVKWLSKKNQPILLIWQWLIYYVIIRLIVLLITLVFASAFLLWAIAIGQNILDIFGTEYFAKFLMPYLLLSAFGTGGATLAATWVHYQDQNQAYVAS